MPSGPEDSSVATYKKIEVSLRARIGCGAWIAGSMLPSRRDLAREYGVSPITIERAISPLINEGLLRADDRRGTFVAEAVLSAGISTAPAVHHPDVPIAVLGPSSIIGSPSSARRQSPPATIAIVASLYIFNDDHLALHNFWIRLMVESLERNLSSAGHTTRFFNRVNKPGEPPIPLRVALREAVAEGTDALAVIGFGLTSGEVDDALEVVDTTNLPTVCITADALLRPVPHVFLDNRSAGYQAAQCLLHNGCRDILFLAPFTSTWVEERVDGARAAIEHARLPLRTLDVFPRLAMPWKQEEDPQVIGYEAGRQLLDTTPVSGGVICANDGVAFGYVRAAAEHDLRPGRDFSIVGFDDHPDARLQQLTSLRPPMEEMGQEASRLLLQALGGSQAALQVRLPWHLIPRASSHVTHTASDLPARDGGV